MMMMITRLCIMHHCSQRIYMHWLSAVCWADTTPVHCGLSEVDRMPSTGSLLASLFSYVDSWTWFWPCFWPPLISVALGAINFMWQCVAAMPAAEERNAGYMQCGWEELWHPATVCVADQFRLKMFPDVTPVFCCSVIYFYLYYVQKNFAVTLFVWIQNICT